MKNFFTWLACILHIYLGGCVDYVNLRDNQVKMDEINFAPIIDAKHLSPHPSRLLSPISIGKNCKGQIFKVPPIEDRNPNDKLYYLWFLDNKLVQQQAMIEPEYRHTAIITLNVDSQFIQSHFENRIPDDFYTRAHVLELLVSDWQYKIPESGFIDEKVANENNHVDYVYWIVFFSDSC